MILSPIFMYEIRTHSLRVSLINHLSPIVKPNVDSELNQGAVVLSEQSLNAYVNRILKNELEIKEVSIKVLDNNEIQITCEIEKLLDKTQVSRVLKIERFVINQDNAEIKFQILGNLNEDEKMIFNKIAFSIGRFLLKNIFNKKISWQLEFDSGFIENDMITIDLKNGVLKQYYEKNLREVLDEKFKNMRYSRFIPTTIADEKITALFEMKGIYTESKELILDFGFSDDARKKILELFPLKCPFDYHFPFLY